MKCIVTIAMGATLLSSLCQPADAAQRRPAPARHNAPARPVSGVDVSRRNTLELRLSGGGLETGQLGLHSSRLYEFQGPAAPVIAAVTAIRGPVRRREHLRNCGASAMDLYEWGGFALHVASGRFVGWSINAPVSPAIQDEFGIGIGTSAADLRESDQGPATFSRSAGVSRFEFSGMSGSLSGQGSRQRVRTIEAGAQCVAG